MGSSPKMKRILRPISAKYPNIFFPCCSSYEGNDVTWPAIVLNRLACYRSTYKVFPPYTPLFNPYPNILLTELKSNLTSVSSYLSAQSTNNIFCQGTPRTSLVANSGIIQSRYSNYANCSWTITVPQNMVSIRYIYELIYQTIKFWDILSRN